MPICFSVLIFFQPSETFELLAGFRGLTHLELNLAFSTIDELPSTSGHPFLNKNVVSGFFRHIHAERMFQQNTFATFSRRPQAMVMSSDGTEWPRLQAMDIKVGEWEHLLNVENTLGARRKHIFACRPSGRLNRELTTFLIPGKKPLFNQHESYARALASVGFWDIFDAFNLS